MKVIARRPFDFSYLGEMFVAGKGDEIEMPQDLVDKLEGAGLFDLASASAVPAAPAAEPKPDLSPAAADEGLPAEAAQVTAEPLVDGSALGAGPAPVRRGKRR